VQPKTILIYVSHLLLLLHFASHSTYSLSLCLSLPLPISLFSGSGSDSEVALAVKEQSIICLKRFINIVYIAVLKQRGFMLFRQKLFLVPYG